MPVSKSARGALRVSDRRHAENLKVKYSVKKALKGARKAIEAGTEEVKELLSLAQSALDKAAKNNSIHPNKAARLKSRLAKKAATTEVKEVVVKVIKEKVAAKKSNKKVVKKTVKKAASKAKK